jgi:cysteine desulfurase / selenocysteine lyase
VGIVDYDVDALRAREFPWTARGDAIYLNNASTGAQPARSVAAQAAFNALRADPSRLRPGEDIDLFRVTRSLVARLINAKPAEIACMGNTTYGINIAARALPLRAGDVVLTHDGEFPTNIYPWMALAKQGVRLERIPLRDGLPDEARLLEELRRPEVRVVTTSWVTFATGYRADLAAIGRACRERGIYFVVDAIQGLGALTLDVAALDIDILACGGQKWLLSPWGTGFAYIREELARTLEPAAVGWMSVRASEDFTRLVDYDFTYHDDARRFEVITLPAQDFAGLNASLELLFELGPATVASYIASLVSCGVDWARGRDDVRLVTPADPARRAGILSIAPRDPAAASRRLTEARISHSLREGAIRLSPHGYNTRAELQRALCALVGEDRAR